MSPPTMDDIILLDMTIRGCVILPGTLGYDAQTKRTFNAMLHVKKPAMFIKCKDTEDVQEAVKFVARHGMKLCIYSGGHSPTGDSIEDGAVVVDLELISHTVYDDVTQTVRVGPGACLSDVNVHLLRRDRMTPVGVAPPTGCGGLVLHGGMGWLKHRFGLSVDNVESVTIVLASGSVRELNRQSEGEDRELFYGVRGYAGGLGIVTDFTMKTYPMEMMIGGFWVMVDDDTYSNTRDLVKIARDMQIEQDMDGNERRIFGGIYAGNIPPDPSVPEEHHGSHATIVSMGAWGTDDTSMAMVKKFVNRDIMLGNPPAVMPFNIFNQLRGRVFLTAQPLGSYWKGPFVAKEDASDESIDKWMDKWMMHEPWLNPSMVGMELQGGDQRHAINLNEGNDHSVSKLRNVDISFLFVLMFREPNEEKMRKARMICLEMNAIYEGKKQASYSNCTTRSEGEAEIKSETSLTFSDISRLRAIKEKVDPTNLFCRGRPSGPHQEKLLKENFLAADQASGQMKALATAQ